MPRPAGPISGELASRCRKKEHIRRSGGGGRRFERKRGRDLVRAGAKEVPGSI